MPSVGFEPTISAGERPKTYALVRAATGTGSSRLSQSIVFFYKMFCEFTEFELHINAPQLT